MEVISFLCMVDLLLVDLLFKFMVELPFKFLILLKFICALEIESLWTLQLLRISVACIGACFGLSTVMLIFPVCQLCACVGGGGAAFRVCIFPEACDWYSGRVDITEKRSERVSVQTTELRSHWFVYECFHFRSTTGTSKVFWICAEGLRCTTIKWFTETCHIEVLLIWVFRAALWIGIHIVEQQQSQWNQCLQRACLLVEHQTTTNGIGSVEVEPEPQWQQDEILFLSNER